MKKFSFLSVSLFVLMLFCSMAVSAQDAVKWSASVKMTSATEGVISIVGNIQSGWHLYGFNQSPDGPNSTQVKIAAPASVKFTDKMRYSPSPIAKMDDMFGVDVTYWENKVTLTRKFKIAAGAAPEVTFEITYMACNDSMCQPPKTVVLKVKLK